MNPVEAIRKISAIASEERDMNDLLGEIQGICREALEGSSKMENASVSKEQALEALFEIDMRAEGLEGHDAKILAIRGYIEQASQPICQQEADHEAIEIGTISNYYGGLYLKREVGMTFGASKIGTGCTGSLATLLLPPPCAP